MRKPNYLNGTFYLNQSGTRIVHYIDGKKSTHMFTTKSGKQVERTLIYQYAFGNFSGALISYKGKKIKVLLDTLLDD